VLRLRQKPPIAPVLDWLDILIGPSGLLFIVI